MTVTLAQLVPEGDLQPQHVTTSDTAELNRATASGGHVAQGDTPGSSRRTCAQHVSSDEGREQP